MRILKKISRSMFIKASLAVVLVIGIKLVFQYFGIEFLAVNPLLTAIISGNIFILGFLLNSTLRDYKEAEKYPGDFSTSLEAIYDECEIQYSRSKNEVFLNCIEQIRKINQMIFKWFQKKEYTQNVLYEISELNKFMGEFEQVTQPNFIVRLKNEQSNLRRMMVRVNILRDTPFYDTSYKLAKLTVAFLLIMLTLLTASPFYEYLFFIAVIVFINVFLVNLIRDLDDPFEYNEGQSDDEVSLKPLCDLEKRIEKRLSHLNE